MRSNRAKACHQCGQTAPVLYRIRHDASAQWIFVCELCLLNLRHNNPYYTYGGTWKAGKSR